MHEPGVGGLGLQQVSLAPASTTKRPTFSMAARSDWIVAVVEGSADSTLASEGNTTTCMAIDAAILGACVSGGARTRAGHTSLKIIPPLQHILC